MRHFLSHLFDNSVWSLPGLLALQPPLQWHHMWYYIAFLGICLVGLLSLLIFRKYIRANLINRLSSLFLTNLVLGGILYFFRIQQIPILGMDVWRFFQECATVIWIFSIVRFYLRDYRHELTQEKIAARRNKYLPGNN
jgi:hypothetical protein